jgi:hypothetical protein
VLLAVAGNDLEVTSQGRLELRYVAQSAQFIHGAVPISSRQPVSVQAWACRVPKFLALSLTGMDVLAESRQCAWFSDTSTIGIGVARSG